MKQNAATVKNQIMNTFATLKANRKYDRNRIRQNCIYAHLIFSILFETDKVKWLNLRNVY